MEEPLICVQDESKTSEERVDLSQLDVSDEIHESHLPTRGLFTPAAMPTEKAAIENPLCD